MKRLEAQLELAQVRVFGDADFAARPHLVKGYIGPGALGKHRGVRYLLDPRVVDGSAWVTGADAPNRHVIDLVAGRDFRSDGTIDVAEVRVGDPCPECGAGLEVHRGIEVGHIFQLGRKYAHALAFELPGPDGQPVVPTMGSYGIGVSRAVAAIAETTLDELGLCWPREISPADLHLVTAGNDHTLVEFSDQLATDLGEAGVRVLYDDRAGVSAGVKFKDAELIGVPTFVVVGKALANDQVEVRDRRSRTTALVPAGSALQHLIELTEVGSG
jgi:prolyl-tRNA synthetase